jgi:hypothetical protein
MSVPNPTVLGPISGGDHGQAFGALPAEELKSAGYTESEYFYSGTASAYGNVGTWGVDGIWPAKAASTAPYKVRMLVRRPADARRFNGILIVEWLNVTALMEGAADFMQMQELLDRDGYAWVGLAARYGSLEHPGDNYAFDIYSQGGQALRHPQGIDPLGGLKIHT